MNYEKKRARTKFISLFEDVLEYYKGIIITLVVGTVVGLCIYGYSSYRTSKNQNAYKTFMECMRYFDAPVNDKQKSGDIDIDTIHFASREEKWEKVASIFNKAYYDNPSNGISPFFLAFEAEALLNQGKRDRAVELLSQATLEIKDPVLKSYYSLKLALMKLDSTDNEAHRQSGFDMLRALAEDSQNQVQDAALFYLGSHFWYERNFELAKNYWNQLLLSCGPDSKNPSPWAEQAKEKLKLITSK